MGDEFVVKGLFESKEIQSSYDEGKYIDAVMKCRIYIEGWLSEYIYAILFPTESGSKKEDRQYVRDKFEHMHIKINWLKQQKYLSDDDYKNLNKIRIFTDKVFRSGEVFKVVNKSQLDHQIETAIYYCARLKEATRRHIDSTTILDDKMQ